MDDNNGTAKWYPSLLPSSQDVPLADFHDGDSEMVQADIVGVSAVQLDLMSSQLGNPMLPNFSPNLDIDT